MVGKGSIASLGALLDAVPGQVAADELNVGWSLSAPDGTARFIWSEDYSKSPLHDVMLEFDAQPFLAAGLDPDKLPDEIAFYENMLMVGKKPGDNELKYGGAPTPLASYEKIVELYGAPWATIPPLTTTASRSATAICLSGQRT